jgi:hypothetical protein
MDQLASVVSVREDDGAALRGAGLVLVSNADGDRMRIDRQDFG